MSIKNKSAKALRALKDTLRACPHIQNVYFAVNGDHFFNVKEYGEKGQKPKLYGRLKTEQRIAKVVGDKVYWKVVPVPDPSCKIVETLSAEEVLAYEPDAAKAANSGAEATKGKGTKKWSKKNDGSTATDVQSEEGDGSKKNDGSTATDVQSEEGDEGGEGA